MEKYRSLPFATYDLAVYLPGGAVLLVIANFALDWITGWSAISAIHSLDQGAFGVVVQALFWLSVSYLAGHLGAFISTYVIERFVHNALGYPSDLWLKHESGSAEGKTAGEIVCSSIRGTIRGYPSNVSSRVVAAFQAPLAPLHLVFAWIIPAGFYATKLPSGLMPDVRRKYLEIQTAVPLEQGTRWEKIVEHYVSNNCPLAYARMYNYLVIYGALRLMSFILILSAWIVIGESLLQITRGPVEFSLWKITSIMALSVSAFLSMMAFAKFNRIYFEETILALLFAPRASAT